MKFLHCEKWFIFENDSHTYKTKDGVEFQFKYHDGWQIVWNEELLKELRSEYEKHII